MLVLTRHRNESVMIGSDVEMKVIDIRGDKVRLGFSASKSIQIHRKEIYDEIIRETLQAAQLQPGDLPRVIESTATNPLQGPFVMDPFLRAAVDEAKLGLSEGGLPIGSVLVRGNEIIGRGHNRRVQDGNSMAHAEINCLSNAGRQKSYADTTLYSTLMPCFLCSGAVVQFGIPRVIVGESTNFPGGCCKGGTSPDFLRSHGVEITDRQDEECITMMRTFIESHPDLWNEDIGAN